MKDNRDILNEAFFKKATYEEKQKAKMPQYTPVDAKKVKDGSGLIPEPGAYSVADNEELKRRLSNTFGVVFGGNSVRSAASKAIKEFPIIVSDTVEPETIVMLKKLMEEQYAEYINLLISNQVIDLADYRSNSGDGNIAIQALDTISGTEFGKGKLADKAANTGSITPDDVFSTIPLYTLLRESKSAISTGDTLTDSLLEGAVVVPSSEADSLAKFISNHADEIVPLTEAEVPVPPRYRLPKDADIFDRDYGAAVNTRDINMDIKRGWLGQDASGDDVFSKLSSADIVFDEKALDHAINRTVGEILMDDENAPIRDKFEKATFLLQSRRISGIEYYQYLTLRLGIPVSDKARQQLVHKYRVGEIRDYTDGDVSTPRDRYKLKKNRMDNLVNSREIDAIVEPITRCKLKTVLAAIGFGAIGAGAGAGIGAAVGYGISSVATPLICGVLAGAAVGSGAYLLYKLLSKKPDTSKVEGWERVERLIILMENRQAEVIQMAKERQFADEIKKKELDIKLNKEKERLEKILKSEDIRTSKASKEDIEKIINDKSSLDDYTSALNAIHNRLPALAESVDHEDNSEFRLDLSPLDEAIGGLTDELFADKHFKAEILSERAVRTSMPIQVKYVEKKPGSNVLYSPSNFSRSSYAYGSTEIERKDNKDRRYNQPLIMKVRFKERYDDGKYSDNELTAVIGILGKVIRVPSSEMEYILKENAEGRQIDGILQAAIDNDISQLMATSKIATELKKLPQSGDIWHNLERVASLAAANAITGRRNRNIANAHIIFAQREIDACRIDNGVDYLKDIKKTVALMKRYSAFTLMIANDGGQRAYIFDDQDKISWDVLPYSALAGKDNGEQLAAALNKLGRL